MAKLRKMLGSADHPGILALMRQMETQSHKTLVRWCTDYMISKILPLYEARNAGDTRPREALAMAQAWVNGEKTVKETRDALAAGRAAAREAGDPVSQAAARAIDSAATSLRTPTGALGCVFYAAAALAYDRGGLQAEPAVYDACADEVFADMLQKLCACSVENEPNPAKLDWGC